MAAWTLVVDGTSLPDKSLIGGKAWSLARMRSMGLPVPPAFVVTTRACTHVVNAGELPADLEGELRDGIAYLESETGRRFGAGPRPLLVSVRSGAAISMPGMMDTVLNLGIQDDTEALLAAECGDAAFARDTHRRFLELYAGIVLHAPPAELDRGASPAAWRDAIARVADGPVPGEAHAQLLGAVRAVFDSWNSRRARRYREHNRIPHDLGTAVTIQAMVFGNLDDQSGTGVLFSRNPLTGEPLPYGEWLARAQGEDVVSGRFTPRPLSEMAALVPDAHAQLLAAARLLETGNGDMQDIEFTVERGRFFLLQSRAGKRAPQAALRIAVDMVHEGLIDEAAAVSRVTPEQLAVVMAPRLDDAGNGGRPALASGEGACPGIGIGIVVTDSDEAEKRAAAGEAVVLARPTTSPEDVHGMIAACAVITETGGSTSHAAVVSRSLGRPCIVGCGVGTLASLAGRLVTVDGGRGRVHDGALKVSAPDEKSDPQLAKMAEWRKRHAAS